MRRIIVKKVLPVITIINLMDVALLVGSFITQERGIKVDASKIDPALDPRFAQEWGRIEAELNSQYGQALEQCRSQLSALSGV